MNDEWFIERKGRKCGPYTRDQLREMLAAGQLQPDELTIQRGGDKAVRVRRVADPSWQPKERKAPAESDEGQDAASAQEPPARLEAKWIVIGVAAVLYLIGIAWALGWLSLGDPIEEFPNWPEWFQSEYRVRPPQKPPIPPGTVFVEGMGFVNKDQVPSPGEYSEKWLDQLFSHYTVAQQPYWARARMDPTSPAGIMPAGAKVIAGPELNGLTLVCTCTRDHRVINMFVDRNSLRKRSLGPPESGKP
jgi:hypothetical protein